MGKTTVVDAVRDDARARGFEVIETQGIEADAELGFGALLTLLRPVEGALDELAGPFADDLRAALTLGTRRPTDDGRVRLALYRVVTTLAETRPVAMLVDDAHHLDAATSSALAFVLGRLGRDCVAALLTSDGELPAPLADLALPSEPLRRLPAEELHQLITDEVGAVAPDALTQCCGLADGNPLIALELARSLTDAERAGEEPVSMLPRPPAALARRYALRFDRFDPVASRALAVVAADDTGRAAVVRAALTGLGEPADALDRAEQTGVIFDDGPTLRFTHPVLRAVAYHRVAPASRRAAHRALAVALSDPEDAVARAWQLAAAADGEDENAAEALTLVAGDLVRRGAGPSAARVYERAAALSPSRAARAERALRAADAWLDAFAPDSAARAVHDLALGSDPDVLVGVAAVIRWADGPVHALDRVRAVSDGPVRALARALEADLLLDASGEAAARDAARAVLDDAIADPAAREVAAAVAARAMGATTTDSGDHASGSHRVAALVARRRAQADAEAGVPAGAIHGSGVEMTLVRATSARHSGDVTGAYDRLQLELGLVPGRAVHQRAVLELALADVEQLLGRTDDARARAEQVVARLDEAHARGLAAGGRWVLGRLTLAAGDAEQGCAVLEAAAQARPMLYGPELAVALAGVGRTAAAERVVATADPSAPAGPVVAARSERARAAVRADDALFRQAAARATAAGLPIEAGETLLAHAEHLLRAGRTDDAHAVAQDARNRFDAAGVRGWDARLARLVKGTPTTNGVAAELTSAEYRVALAVSDGATNREAAASLFLSVKTVDFHLQNIYRKLGLRSRTELAVRVRGEGAGAQR